MTDVLWSVVAERELITLASSDAERIIDAVEMFVTRRLHVPGYAVTFETQGAKMVVLRVQVFPRPR